MTAAAEAPKRPPRNPQRDPTCSPITAAMRATMSIPPGALWHVSWVMVPAGAERARRYWTFLLSDGSARKWCAVQGVPFPGDQAVAEAARGDSALARQVVAAREPHATGEADDSVIDVRGRAAGEHL